MNDQSLNAEKIDYSLIQKP